MARQTPGGAVVERRRGRPWKRAPRGPGSAVRDLMRWHEGTLPSPAGPGAVRRALSVALARATRRHDRRRPVPPAPRPRRADRAADPLPIGHARGWRGHPAPRRGARAGGVRVPPGRPGRDRQPLRPARAEGGRADLRLQRPHRRGAAGRSGCMERRSVRGRGARRLALGAGRHRHEVGRGRLRGRRRGRGSARGLRRGAGRHGRRGGRLDRRHARAARLDGGAWRGVHGLRGGRADLPRGLRRHRQDRPAWGGDVHRDRAGGAGALGLPRAGAQPGARARAAGGPAVVAPARRGDGAFRPFDVGRRLVRHRQPGLERDPRRVPRRDQRALQRRAFVGVASGSGRGGGRRARGRDRHRVRRGGRGCRARAS